MFKFLLPLTVVVAGIIIVHARQAQVFNVLGADAKGNGNGFSQRSGLINLKEKNVHTIELVPSQGFEIILQDNAKKTELLHIKSQKDHTLVGVKQLKKYAYVIKPKKPLTIKLVSNADSFKVYLNRNYAGTHGYDAEKKIQLNLYKVLIVGAFNNVTFDGGNKYISSYQEIDY
uniref:DUF2846 domain-containing protein n=1 Tax=Panagrellus redivivus TaxID=6233 RepID=A0A7E4ZXP1_PANRE